MQIPATTGEALPPAGQEGTVYTIMNVTENDVSLYGFADEEQRDCFKMLTGCHRRRPQGRACPSCPS